MEYVGELSMFFAGLILLIPHRIGMSRVNYVIKRYNLPISRAGLLLYKFHNPIEVSLTIGTLLGNVINWVTGYNEGQKYIIVISMIIFLFFMLLSSIYMFRIYITGDDYGYLDHFYFSLILITLFDGFSNAHAFGLNARHSSFLSAGIPTSGLLISVLHNIYKLFSDTFHWDNFDYYVLFIQLFLNVIGILITIILWSVDGVFNQSGGATVAHIKELFGLGNTHALDWCPIGMLAISLGTVYAFYPSIAPYSIIDYQYASVIELWILFISAILPFVVAILDYFHDDKGWGPGGKYKMTSSKVTSLKVTHTNQVKHGNYSTNCTNTGGTGHDWNTGDGDYTPKPGDKYKDNSGIVYPLNSKLIIYYNWFHGRKISTDNWATEDDWIGAWWNAVWICVIFYILCIQIFMTLLHYPDSLLSLFFNNHPYVICFISILFNTLREFMQACGFAGAGKQAYLDTSKSLYDDKSISEGNVKNSSDGQNLSGNDQLLLALGSGISGKTATLKYITDTDNRNATVNGTIAATNKLITLFVMMFCVFTGDGYLQHHRRCCRDCWPTTGFTKYQSFFYWLRYGFKGGSKYFITAFTTTVKTQNIITNNVINLFVAAMEPFTFLSAALI